jgi:TolB-like protein
MKKLITTTVALLSVCILAPAQNQGMDKELAALGEKLAAQVKESGKKKVTVLDFTDLQGNTSDLGRFIAEELSVLLVERRTNFSVMDRANLKTILAEHKLTVDGLVEPENAKKLGQFSGVDAIVLGKVTPLKDEVAITAKVIATDTAETVGAARGRIPMGKEIEHLLASAVSSGGSSDKPTAANKPQLDLAKLLQIEKNSLQVDDVFIKVESLRYVYSQSQLHLTTTLVIVNTNLACGIGVAIDTKSPGPTLSNGRGEEFSNSGSNYGDIVGIAEGYDRGGGVEGNFTGIPPGKSIRVILKNHRYGKEENIGPYRLQFGLYTGKDAQGRVANIKNHTVLLDVDAAK